MFRKSAEQGDANSQFFLGVAYYYGQGIIEDYVYAFAWANVAKANGYKSKELIDSIRKKMSKEQIALGLVLARELFRKIESKDFDDPVNSRLE